MTFDDLICPECGEGPRDVARSAFLREDDYPMAARIDAVAWTCERGHAHVSGHKGDGIAHMRIPKASGILGRVSKPSPGNTPDR